MVAKKPSVTVRAALIGGTLALLGSFVLVFGPALLKYLDEQRPLRIIHVATATRPNRVGVDILLSNNSSRQVAASSITFRWSKGGVGLPFPVALVVVPSETYEIHPQIEVLSGTEGRLTGPVAGQADPRRPTVLSAQGHWLIFDEKSWSLQLLFPIRQQLEAGQHLSLVVLIPQNIPITGDPNRVRQSPHKDYFLGNPPTQFQLKRFLANQRDVGVEVELTYEGGRHTSFSTDARYTADN